MKQWILGITLFWPVIGACSPACLAISTAGNSVVLNLKSVGWVDYWDSRIILKSISGGRDVALDQCMKKKMRGCYFATEVPAGEYFVKRVATPGTNFDMSISDAKAKLLVRDERVNYLGDWSVKFKDKFQGSEYQVAYPPQSLLAIIADCGISGKRFSLSQVGGKAMDVTIK